MIDHLVTPRSMRGIREIVNAIKIHFGFYDCLKFPIMFFWEHIIPIIFPGYRFLYVEDDELKGVEAYTDHNLRLVKVKVSVYERALNGSPKDLFTIAHEIGHLFMHDGETMIFARTSERFPAYKSAEWQANYFAAEMLMASHLIVDMSINEIMKECNVNERSARIQLDHAISEREKIVYSDCINLVIAVTKLYIKYIVKEVMNYENKKRIHHLLQQIMNSNSEMFPSKIQLYINTSEYIKSKYFYIRKEVL